jgi:hypothetical protein
MKWAVRGKALEMWESIGDVGVAVAEMDCSSKSIGNVGVAVVVDAHGKPMQAKGDNDAAQSSGKISCNFHIELLLLQIFNAYVRCIF